MNKLGYQIFYERYLPHYQPPGSILFITFRLADSLPAEARQRMHEEAHLLQQKYLDIDDDQLRKETKLTFQWALFQKFDNELDASAHRVAWLANPDVAHMVSQALHYWDQKKYILDAFCIMPNHVHVVCEPLNNHGDSYPISQILHSIKSYTAHQANKILRREGEFWQHESYDHVIRDNDEYLRIINYVQENPIRAGLLTDWVYVRNVA